MSQEVTVGILPITEYASSSYRFRNWEKKKTRGGPMDQLAHSEFNWSFYLLPEYCKSPLQCTTVEFWVPKS